MSASFRFHAPRLPLTAEADWLLDRAFGPVGPARSPALSGSEVLRVGAKLDLIARVAARIPRDVLKADLGESTAAEFENWREATAVQQNSLRLAADQICSAAAELGVPVIFLKGMALLSKNRGSGGARAMSDVDLLCGGDGARTLQARLIDLGWREHTPGGRAREDYYHLDPLVDDFERVIEIHTRLEDVDGPDGTSFTADELLSRGLLDPVPDVDGDVFVPNDATCAAHLLVHGIDQHLNRPQLYAPTRLFADLADFRWTRAQWDEFLAGGFAWIAASVSRREVEAVIDFIQSFEEGRGPREILEADGDAARVIEHFVALVDSEHYDGTLALRHNLGLGWREASRKFLRNLFPPAHEVRRHLADSAGRSAVWGWHVKRPFRLLARFARWSLGAFRERT